MGEGDATVAFEEDHAQAVGESTGHQLREAIPVGLGPRRETGLSDGHRSIKTKSVTPAAGCRQDPRSDFCYTLPSSKAMGTQ